MNSELGKGDNVTVKSKVSAAGMTKGKVYDVIEEIKCTNSFKIILDNGTVGVKHRCAFECIAMPEGGVNYDCSQNI